MHALVVSHLVFLYVSLRGHTLGRRSRGVGLYAIAINRVSPTKWRGSHTHTNLPGVPARGPIQYMYDVTCKEYLVRVPAVSFGFAFGSSGKDRLKSGFAFL
jgi:hypothetical protein